MSADVLIVQNIPSFFVPVWICLSCTCRFQLDRLFFKVGETKDRGGI